MTIHNTGNTPASFNVVGRDLQNFVRFRGEREGVALQPNQTANIELVLEMRETNFFGEEDAYPFEVEVAAGPSAKQTLPGEAIARSIIPTPWLYALLFLLIFGCVLGALALFSNWGRFLGIGARADGHADAVLRAIGCHADLGRRGPDRCRDHPERRGDQRGPDGAGGGRHRPGRPDRRSRKGRWAPTLTIPTAMLTG
ncbi:MAG: hypothetical protein V9E96_10475 [Chitinophagaceae bacterium]